MSGDSRVTVVVLTHDRVRELARTLARLAALPERPRVIVVDNASPDDPTAAVARVPGATLVRLAENAGAAGRNAGVRAARTPYVALCDDDTWWAPGALARAAALLDAHPRLAVVSGKVVVGPEERIDPACAAMAASPLPRPPGLPGTPLLGFLAGASMVRRAAFVEVGGFEPRLFIGGEERLLAADLAAAGWGIAYVEDVVVHHHPSSRRDEAGRRSALLRNALWFAWMRRPARSALRETLRVLRSAPLEPASVRAVVQALAGLAWVVRRRRVLPPGVERGFRRLEDAEAAGPRGQRLTGGSAAAARGGGSA